MALLGIHATACLILFIIGLALLLVEMLTPGLGVSGLLGVAAFIAIIILQFIGNSTAAAWLVTAILLILIVAMLAWVIHSFQYGGKSRLILQDAVQTNASPTAESQAQDLHVGVRGTTITALRPSGIVAFGDRRETANSNGEFIEAGVSVEIQSASGLNITVKRA